MSALIHELLTASADRTPDARAVKFKSEEISYADLRQRVERFAQGLIAAGLQKQQRVAVYLPKRPETVVTIFGAPMAGGVFVPVNPLLKPPQVAHILRDCAVRVLVTSAQRATELATEIEQSPDLRPEEVDRRPESMGRAISNTEITMVCPHSALCDPANGFLCSIGRKEEMISGYRVSPTEAEEVPFA